MVTIFFYVNTTNITGLLFAWSMRGWSAISKTQHVDIMQDFNWWHNQLLCYRETIKIAGVGFLFRLLFYFKQRIKVTFLSSLAVSTIYVPLLVWMGSYSFVERSPRVVVSTAAFHARVRGSFPGLCGMKGTKIFLPHPLSIVGSLRDREVACSASDLQGLNFESYVWRAVSSHSSHHPQEFLLAQFSLYVHQLA